VVLASATPALESFYAAEMGRHHLLRLPTRVEERPLPSVRVVDSRKARPGPAILSAPLRQAIASRLRLGEQVILFLNRRGYATFLLCPACGEAVRCPDCGVSLTYHRGEQQVRCHHCGLARRAPSVCPRCGGHNIRFSGFGTERVEKELAAIFPQAASGRLDRDTTARRGSHVRIVGRFRAAETSILIGTQMVAKGFDFPGVTLVGVISADTALNLPDFRAAERTFQLLTQVSGRSGRGEKEGEVVIQTFRPDHYSVAAAARQDYEEFYRQEIETRRELNYPPFSQLANLVVSGEDEGEVQRRAEKLAEEIRARAAEGLEVLGPAAAPIARLRGKHRWHLLVRARPGELSPRLRAALAGLGDWAATGVTVDVDPVSLM
jgi:primosomal protein N' (replication factor Y)